MGHHCVLCRIQPSWTVSQFWFLNIYAKQLLNANNIENETYSIIIWNFLWEKIISRNLNSFFPSSASSMFPGSHWVSVTSKNSPFYGKDELKMISVSLGKLVCRTVRLLIHTEWESHLVFHGASPSFSSSSFSGHFMSSRGGCCSPDHHLFIWVSWLSALISILN